MKYTGFPADKVRLLRAGSHGECVIVSRHHFDATRPCSSWTRAPEGVQASGCGCVPIGERIAGGRGASAGQVNPKVLARLRVLH